MIISECIREQVFFLPFSSITLCFLLRISLHNFHVKQGKGSAQSMKKFRKAFAVNWDDKAENSEMSLVISQKNPIRLGKKLTTRDSSSVSKWARKQESVGLDRVKKRCKVQYDALSIWWKVAVQSYIQQRMWMQLGHRPSDFLLPPRFERVYQPTKLIQFDKIFSRVFAKPMRLSRLSTTTDDDTDLLIFNRKKIHATTTQSDMDKEEKEEELMDEGYSESALGDFINEHGYTSASVPNLSNFRKYALTHSKSNTENETFPSFVGSNMNDVNPSEAYISYTKRISPEVNLSNRKCREQEFIQCLRDSLLQSDDVDGILKVSFLHRTAHFSPAYTDERYFFAKFSSFLNLHI